MENYVDKILVRLHDCKHFDFLTSLCGDVLAYVVGGAIRDAVVGCQITDIDLVLPHDPTSIAKAFASRVGGSWFWLDESRLHSRVVFAGSQTAPYYDFAPFRADDLDGDLRGRDFTINAVALDLSHQTLDDPCNGLDDLRLSVLRTVSPDSLADDPLRIIKGVRHAACLGLGIESETLKSMRDNLFGLDQIAVERIRQEVFKILSAEHAGQGLWLLNECAAGRYLFGDGFEQSLHIMIASLSHYHDRWERLVDIYPYVTQWLNGEIEHGLSRRTLLLFILLLQQIDRSLPESVAGRWLLGRKAKELVTVLASIDSVMQTELALVARTPRALYWWTEKIGAEVKSLLLFLACYDLSTGSSVETVGSWLPIAAQLDDERQPDLVYGRWLTEHLGIEEGPEISRALELLRNAEISGEVTSEEEARRFLSQVYLDSD